MSEKTISGLDNLGRCVDLVDLDPLDIVGSSKNVQAFFPKGGEDSYVKGDYKIPKGVETRSPFKLRVSGGETLMSNSYDFTRSFEKSVSIEGGFAGFEFSASQSVKNVQKESAKRDEVFTYVFANSAIHIVQLDLDGIQSQYLSLNADIKKKVQDLPVLEGKAYKDLPVREGKAYKDFIIKFGTHFLTQVALGGMAWSRVSSKKKEQSSSTESEETFKTEAKAELQKFTAGFSKSESRNQVAQQDQKLGITRSELTFVGGTGNVTEISSSWVGSLDDKSVPIYEELKLGSLSSLLTAKYFPNDTDIAKKQQLLEEATTVYIKERGGEEGQRIRYGQPVRLETAYLRRPLYYGQPTTQRGIRLFTPSTDQATPSGARTATFIISSPDRKTGDEVLTGDPVKLELSGNGILAIGSAPKPRGLPGDDATLTFHTQGGASVQDETLSLRIRGSGQRYDGEEMREKRKPLVSGDIVMICHYDPGKGFACLTASPFAVLTAEAFVSAWGWMAKDHLFMDRPLYSNMVCDSFVIRNV